MANTPLLSMGYLPPRCIIPACPTMVKLGIAISFALMEQHGTPHGTTYYMHDQPRAHVIEAGTPEGALRRTLECSPPLIPSPLLYTGVLEYIA